MTQTKVQLSVADSHLHRMDEVAEAARQAGFQLEQRLDGVGVMTGSAPPDAIERLRGVPGIGGIEAERTIQLPDPGSPVQ